MAHSCFCIISRRNYRGTFAEYCSEQNMIADEKRTYPKVAPRVFKIISSTSKQPTFVTSWITSTVRLNINPDTQMRKPLFILRKITGRINPKGRKPITFPNMLENTANVPSCSRYIQNLLISTKGIRLYLYTRCASAALPYSSEKNRK